MPWSLVAVTTPVVLGAIAWIAGSRLPREHVAAVRAHYAADRHEIWSLIANPADAASWRGDLKAVRLLPPVDGNATWEEHSRSGVVRYVMTDVEPGRRLTSRIIDKGLPFGGQWEFELSPDSTGTVLTITERGFVSPPVFRVMARLFFGFTSTLKSYHRALASRLRESVMPVVTASGR